MRTPPRLIISNGTRANDGTGDTLRDAADKMNQNFERIWHDIYSPEEIRPGRGFVARVGEDNPDSGGFSISIRNLVTDSDQVLKISRWDTNEKAFKFDGMASGNPAVISNRELSIFSNDSDDKYSLLAIMSGDIKYSDSGAGYWTFTKTSRVASVGQLDSGDSYYISLQGIW